MRKAIKKSVRFEVLKRDSFTCQYCGAKAPEAILHIDHINPVSKGGDNEIINLITSCESCNLGKSAKTLSDNSAIQKQHAQLDQLNERREQLEMMLAWRESIKDIREDEISVVAAHIDPHLGGHTINERGRSSIACWLKKFSVAEVLDAIDVSAEKLPESPSGEDLNTFFDKIPKICYAKRLPESTQRLRYALGILRNRISYLNEAQAMRMMEQAVDAGWPLESIVNACKSVRTWSMFRSEMEAMING